MSGNLNREATRGMRLNFVQHNCRGSNDVFLTLFHVVKGFNVSFICVQDPPLYAGCPLRAPGYECIFRNDPKVRVATNVSLRVLVGVSFVVIPTSEDVLYLRVFGKGGCLVGRSIFFGLINVYNRQVEGSSSVDPKMVFAETREPTLVVGDLNVHTAFTDPL